MNPFFTLTKVANLPQLPEDLLDDPEAKSNYIVNGLFGNEDHSSIVRVMINAKSKKSSLVCDEII